MSVANFNSIPRHLAIIMDGNGRWAQSRGLSRLVGHRKGAETVNNVVTSCRKRGIKVLTLFAFSSQNWSRPSLEVQGLMTLLSTYINSERKKILDNGIRLTSIGDISLLPNSTHKALEDLIKDSSSNDDMVLCLSLSYGGQEEIVAMVRNMAFQASRGELDPQSIDHNLISRSLWSSELGPVDLMIRTSGELRISNFLLWSLAYSELFFTDTMWPDFGDDDLDAAFESFRMRQRRFGAVD